MQKKTNLINDSWSLIGPNRYADTPVARIEVPEVILEKKCLAKINEDFKLKKNSSAKKLSAWNTSLKIIFKSLNRDLDLYLEEPSVKPGFIYVIFCIKNKREGVLIAQKAAELISANFILEKSPNLKEFSLMLKKGGIRPISKNLIAEAKKKNIPSITLVRKPSVIQFGYGSKLETAWSAVTSKTTRTGVRVTVNKAVLNSLLKQIDIPVPESCPVKNIAEVKQFFKKIQHPVVIKPADSTVGKGVTTNIKSLKQALRAFIFAHKVSSRVIMEAQITGEYYRVTFIDGKMIACAKAHPVFVTGNGKKALKELIIKENEKPTRQQDDKNKAFYKIKLTEKIKNIIASQGYNLSSVIPRNKKVQLSFSGADGGKWTDATSLVNKKNELLIKRALRFTNLNIAGVDVISPDISIPFEENGGKILEINAGPDINIHTNVEGKGKILIEKYIIESLFPKKETGRIPIISVTGTNGKTTTSKLIGHIVNNPKKWTTGLTTSANKYINGSLVKKGDMSGSISAKSLLMNPEIDIAILETCHILGIDRHGLGYDWSDTSVITNLTEDHLGTFCTQTFEDLFKIKSVVARRVKKNGYLILNADDKEVAKMAKITKAEVAYFSLDSKNPLIKANIKRGVPVYYLKNNFLWEKQGGKKTKIINARELPITIQGKARFNIYNCLAAIAAVRLTPQINISLRELKNKLRSFGIDSGSNPGRFNLIKKNGIKIVVDYAHNPDGYKQTIALAKKIEAKRFIGIIKSAGDRGEAFMQKLGEIAGDSFDRIYIKSPSKEKLRGMSAKNVCENLKIGVLKSGFNKDKLKIILDEKVCVKKALKEAKKGDLLLIFAHEIEAILKIINKYTNH